MDNMEERVRRVVGEQLGYYAEEIKLDSDFVEDLMADSIDLVELVMAIEDEFDVEIDDDAAERMQTPGDFVFFLNGYKRPVYGL